MAKTKPMHELIEEVSAIVESRPVQLPLWEIYERAMPSEFIAASVFTALQAQRTPHFKKMTLIGEWNGYQLRYKGRRLTQVHADVWLGILEISHWYGGHEDVTVQFTARQLLRVIGRGCGNTNKEQLFEWITDMQACALAVMLPGGRAGFSAQIFLECEWGKDPITGEMTYRLKLNRALCQAYERGAARLNWEVRRQLKRNELALWLQQYLAAFPVPTRVVDLHSLSARVSTLKDFRFKLRGAMTLLTAVGIVNAWEIDADDRLCVRLPQCLPKGGDQAQPGPPSGELRRDLFQKISRRRRPRVSTN